MTQTEREKSSDFIQKPPLKNIKYFTWGIGGPVNLILIGMWGRLQYYSAHILLIPQISISIIFIIYSIVDSFNDPLIGYLADRSTKFTMKYGKRFPWIIIGRLIQPIFLILCFIPISSGSDAIITSIIWITVMMCIFESVGTIAEVNQAALVPDLFRSRSERTKSFLASQIVNFIYQVGIVALFIPIILGGLGGKDSQNAYIGTVIIIAILSYIMLVPFCHGAYENKEMRAFRVQLDQRKKKTSSFKETVVRILKDKNWMACVISTTTYAIAGRCFLAGIEFFMYDGLGLEVNSIEALLPAMILLIFTYIGNLLFFPIVKKYGARNVGIACLALYSFAFLLLFLLPISLLNYLCIFAGLSYGGGLTAAMYIGTEAIDNAVIKSGKREEASYAAVIRVFTAYSYGIQAVLFAIVSSFTGYISGDPSTYTDAAYIGLLMQISLIPCILLVIGLIAFTLMYDITKEDALRNSEKLKEMGL